MQHLKAYAAESALKNECVDPRFSLVARGSAPYVEWLGAADNPNGKGWAVPGKGYGEGVLSLLNKIIAQETPQTPTEPPKEPDELTFPAWQTDGLKALTEAGVINSPEYWEGKLGENITVGEVLGILGKTFAKLTE